jgi:hypothetical protein
MESFYFLTPNLAASTIAAKQNQNDIFRNKEYGTNNSCTETCIPVQKSISLFAPDLVQETTIASVSDIGRESMKPA